MQPRSVLSRELLPASLAIFSTAALASFESLGVAAALPDIAADLGNVSLLPWVITGYLLTSSLATVVAGPFIDSIGVSRMFRLAVTIFATTGFAIAFAPSMEVMVGLRLLQGMGGGLILATGTAAISLIYPGHLVSRAFAANATVWGVMAVAGPAVAAAILTFLSWHWIFYINLPLGILALIAGWKVMPSAQGESTGRFDVVGTLLLTAITVSTLLAVDALDMTSLAWLAVAVASLIAYIRHARQAKNPVVRLDHITPQPFRGLALSTSLLLTGTMAMSTYIPLYVRAGLEGSAALTAWSVLPLTLGWTSGAIASSRMADRASESWIVFVGFMFGIPSLALAWLGVTLNVSIYLKYVVFFTAGMGVGMATNAALTLLRTFAQPAQIGRVVSAHLFARNQGFTFGSAIGGAVLLFVVTLRLGDLTLVRELITSADGSGPAGAAEAVQRGFAASIAVGAGIAVIGLFAAVRLRRSLASARLDRQTEMPGRR